MLLTMCGARLGRGTIIERRKNIEQGGLDRAEAEPPALEGISTAIREAMMFELETPIDRVLSPAPAPNGKVIERAELLAKGDFRDPADFELDQASARTAIHRRLIGRAG
jgi:hypothetical protein